MTRLSVNINKFATLRNARGGNNPDILEAARNAEAFGAQGITVHPRPDGRHIRYDDVYALKEVVTTELNIEGFPDDHFLKLVQEIKPQQVTLVPDAPDVLTSDQGWNMVTHKAFLQEVVPLIQSWGCRVSLFIDPDLTQVEGAALLQADRIELYTGPYAHAYHENPALAIQPYVNAAAAAKQLKLGVNAGHDLDLHNLRYLTTEIPFIDEVSIGHALICDALYYGLRQTIKMYLDALTS